MSRRRGFGKSYEGGEKAPHLDGVSDRRRWMGRLMVLGLAVTVAVAACAVASVVVGRRVRSRRRVLVVLAELEERCATPVGKLKQVVDAMAVEMHSGLASEGGSKLKMLLTFVDRLPNG